MWMFAAKQKMNSVMGDAKPADTSGSQKMRQELAEKRKAREQQGGGAAKGGQNKGKLSQMWAENKAKNQS